MTTWRAFFWLVVVAAAIVALWAWRTGHPGPRRFDRAILVFSETHRPTP